MPRNRDLTVLFHGFFALFASRQRTAYRRGGIYEGTGTLGKDAKGTFTYAGGTGKYAGIEGDGEYTREALLAPVEGKFAAVTTHWGNFQLP